MKDFFAYRTAGRAILPFVILICMLLTGPGTARAGKKASVEIGFVGVPPKSMIGGIGVPNFQNVLLNVQSVRINPKADAAPGNGKWQTIPVPPGIGGAGQSAELQIDLNTSQNVPQLFNTAPVRVDTYRVAEIILDSQNPGTLIPNCPNASPIGNSDGCINYPIQLAAGDVLTVSGPDGGTLVSVAKGTIGSLILQVSMTIVQAPTTPGGAYTVNISLSPVSNSVLGTVSGSVHVNPGTGSGSSTTTKLSITAEAIGTNTAIATTQIQTGSACPSSDPCYTLMLPAAGGPATSESELGFGTLYDLAIAGGGNTYTGARLPPLYPNTSQTVDFTDTNSVTGSQMLGNITGMIYDGCVPLKPIVGANLELLVPPISNSTADCMNFPGQCVVVASANTDNTGFFPLPGTITTPAPFDAVPKMSKTKPYVMQVSAPGYQTMQFLAVAGAGTNKNNGGTCSTDGGTTWIPCNLSLPTAYITGGASGFPIIPPNNGESTLVQVFAEDHDTNNIESALPMPVSVTSSSSGVVPYTINVPPASPLVTAYDLFAATIDLYQGVVDPYQGHSIVTVSGIPAPAACATATAPTITDPTQVIDCVGHGSITGTARNADLGTSVVLEKFDPEGTPDDNEVQIASSIVQNQSPNESPSNNYAFCAPADTYQLQKFEVPAPVSSLTPILPSPTPTSVGTPVSVSIPTPPPINGPTPAPTATMTGSAVPTPSATPTQKVTCPTTCTKPDGSCPGICNNVPVEPL